MVSSWSNTVVLVYRGDWRVFVYHGEFLSTIMTVEFLPTMVSSWSTTVSSCLTWRLESSCLPRWVLDSPLRVIVYHEDWRVVGPPLRVFIYHGDWEVLVYDGEFLVHHWEFLFTMGTGNFLSTTVSSWSTTKSSYLPWGLGTSCLPRWVRGSLLRVLIYHGDWEVLVYDGEFLVHHWEFLFTMGTGNFLSTTVSSWSITKSSYLPWGLGTSCLPRWVLGPLLRVLIYHGDWDVLVYDGEFLVHHWEFLFTMGTGNFLSTTVSSWSTTESSYLPWGLGSSCLPRRVLGPPLRVLIYHGDWELLVYHGEFLVHY